MSPLEIVINEIGWMGSRIEGIESKFWWQYEWLELYNNSDREFDLAGWEIENAGLNGKALLIGRGKIQPNSFFIICKKEMGDCDFIAWGLSLNDDYGKNGKLVLKDPKGVVDQTPDATSQKWPAGEKSTKKTMERKSSSAPGSELTNWQTSQSAGGTLKKENSKDVIETMENNKKSENFRAGIFQTSLPKSLIPVFLTALSTGVFFAVILFFTEKKLRERRKLD